MYDHPPITTLAIPFYLVTLLAEVWWLRKRRNRTDLANYETRDTVTSLLMGVGSLITGIVIIIVDVPIARFFWEHRLTDLGEGAVAWIAALVLWDLSYYWSHRAGHRIRLFWANHVQHHSSEHYNLSTALRQPVTNFYEWFFFPVLALFGVRPWMIFASGGINLVYQYWIHTETIRRMPRWFEVVCNTPSHHRVHHGSNPQYLDKNYCGILIVWDRIFGTFEPEAEPVVYGLTKNIHTFNVVTVATHEYVSLWRDLRATRGIPDKARRLLKGPGWQPTPPALTPLGA